MAGCGVSGAARGAAVVSGGTAVQGGCTVLYITVTAHPWVGELVWKGGLAKRDGGTVLHVCMYVHIYVCVFCSPNLANLVQVKTWYRPTSHWSTGFIRSNRSLRG